VDQKGHLYYSGNTKWFWDNNEYDLLIEIDVKEYEPTNITYDTSRKSEERSQKVVTEKWVTNNGLSDVVLHPTLSMQMDTSETWEHGKSLDGVIPFISPTLVVWYARQECLGIVLRYLCFKLHSGTITAAAKAMQKKRQLTPLELAPKRPFMDI
jgi:hypothetical protein